jgi:dTDP-4-amino-4,6-dideoxygalactose transaminase
VLNALVPHVLAIRHRWPRLYQFIVRTGKRLLGRRLGIFPRPLANEIGAVTAVLRGSEWNMVYGKGLAHERLEAGFAEYLGGGYAIAVNTGGMGLQMSMRALGLKPGDEVIHQVDTCSATAMAVMNAGCTPRFADISSQTLMLDFDDANAAVGPATRAVIATHMWGNVEDMDAALRFRDRHGLVLIEDACLALGAVSRGRLSGSIGDVGVFSFGCLKPIQGGEGGIIVTRDESLARELRAMRHWGDRTLEFGVRDAPGLAWNGRMSEIVAAVVGEQLKGYPAHLERLRGAVAEFARFLEKIDGLELVYGTAGGPAHASFTQIVLRLDEQRFGWSKSQLLAELIRRGVQARHANFELINSLSLFRTDNWKPWIHGEHERVARNFGGTYPRANQAYESGALGLGNLNFLSSGNLRNLMRQVGQLAGQRR